MPGIVGLILQLITVTLIASTITRERESGTLSQLMVTPLRQTEIVIGKVLPYLVISMFLIASTILVGISISGVKLPTAVIALDHLFSISVILAGTRLVDFSLLTDSDPGHSDFHFLSLAGHAVVRGVCPVGAAPEAGPHLFRAVSFSPTFAGPFGM